VEAESIIIREPSEGLCVLAVCMFLLEVLASLMFTCSGTRLHRLTPELTVSECHMFDTLLGFHRNTCNIRSLFRSKSYSYKMAGLICAFTDPGGRTV
jgi:hypothetical protein